MLGILCILWSDGGRSWRKGGTASFHTHPRDRRAEVDAASGKLVFRRAWPRGQRLDLFATFFFDATFFFFVGFGLREPT